MDNLYLRYIGIVGMIAGCTLSVIAASVDNNYKVGLTAGITGAAVYLGAYLSDIADTIKNNNQTASRLEEKTEE